MIIIMLGAPGTGKGTVASILQEKLQIKQVSTGDIFRNEIKNKTEVGIEASKYINNGELVPDDVVIKIIEKRLDMDDLENGAILDGFPRTRYQAEKLEEILKSKGKKVNLVVNLVTPEDEIIERISNRRVCSNQECKTVYNLKMNPPIVPGVCDKCGSKLVQRKDDTVEVIKNRLLTYADTAKPIIDFYKDRGVLYETVISKSVNKLGPEVAEEVALKVKSM